MTVAAVVVDPPAGDVPATGGSAVRRIVESAWAGGALPIVVLAHDSDGSLARQLSGTPAHIVPPALPSPPVPGTGWAQGASPGPAVSPEPAASPKPDVPLGACRIGLEAALQAVVDTDALLAWPGDMAWVDPETVTSLLEAHGVRRRTVLRPRLGERAGWPILLPASALRALIDTLGADGERETLEAALARSAGVAVEALDLGDPGSIHPRQVPLEDLPAYSGPSAPTGLSPPEWGALAAEEPD